MTTAHQIKLNYYYYYYYNHFTAPWTVSGTIRVSQYQKGKTNLDLLERESVCGSEISWAICKSAPRPRQITMPASYHSVFYRPDALPATQPTVSKHLLVCCFSSLAILQSIVWQQTHIQVWLFLASRLAISFCICPFFAAICASWPASFITFKSVLVL